MSNMNEELDNILNGTTSTIVDKLETLRQEMNQEMNKHFEDAFKRTKIRFDICKLNGVVTANQKLVLLYLNDRGIATNAQIVQDTGLNKLTIYRSLEVLMDLGYVVKNRMTFEMRNHNIF